MLNKDKELIIDNYIKEYNRAIYRYWRNPDNQKVIGAINNLNNAYIMCSANNHLKNIEELRRLILRVEKFQHVISELKSHYVKYEIQGLYFIVCHYDNEKYTAIDIKENGDVAIFDEVVDFDDWIAAPPVNVTRFELYVINDEIYTDYELGKCIYEPDYGTGYSEFSECVCDDADEIAKELYSQTNGQFKYVIDVHYAYESSFNGESTEYDSSYTYQIVSREPSKYFDKQEQDIAISKEQEDIILD